MAVTAQISLMNIMFASMPPNILLAVAIVWTLLRGFVAAWPAIVGMGILADVLSFGVPGLTALLLILFSYAASFLSKRFLVEHRGFGIGVMIACIAIATVFYRALADTIALMRSGSFSVSEVLSGMYLSFPSLSLFLIHIALFFFIYSFLTRIERFVEAYDMRIMVKK